MKYLFTDLVIHESPLSWALPGRLWYGQVSFQRSYPPKSPECFHFISERVAMLFRFREEETLPKWPPRASLKQLNPRHRQGEVRLLPGGGGGGTWPKFGYRGAAEGLKSWPCLGQKYAKNPTLCRTTASISGPCLGQVTKCTHTGSTGIKTV